MLGKTGNHPSVFHIEGEDSPQSVQILNTCLSFIECQRSSKNKHYIRDVTCEKFGLENLKIAREVLYTTCDPDQHYGYNGPQPGKSTELQRMHDAFDGIYTKLVKLDAEKKTPSFSVPSKELLTFPSGGSLNDFKGTML